MKTAFPVPASVARSRPGVKCFHTWPCARLKKTLLQHNKIKRDCWTRTRKETIHFIFCSPFNRPVNVNLLLPRTSIGYTPIVPLRSAQRPQHECCAALVSRSRSRSLTELTRQITPPTKNGHAPPPIESRKIFNLSILTMSGPVKFSRVESN